MAHLFAPTPEALLEHQLDITAPQHHVEVKVREDNKVIWVNVDGICILRICQIPALTTNVNTQEEN